jgi:mono/diheme cytochrome c family protein
MPSFSLLDDDDVEALVDYVIYLSVRGEAERRLMAASIDLLGYEETAPDAEGQLSLDADSEGGEVVGMGLDRVVGYWLDAPSTATPATWQQLSGEALADSIARGKEIFHGPIANCVGCHGPGGNGAAVTLDYDDWTKEYSTRLGLTPDDREALRPFRDAGALRPRPIQPRALLNGVFRGGGQPEDLYRRITQGIAGTPMPAVTVVDEPNGTGLTSEQVWDLVRYLRSLGGGM